MKRRLFPSHSPSNLGSATLETHADCRRADCSVNPGNVHDSLHFFDEKEKKDNKKKKKNISYHCFIQFCCLIFTCCLSVSNCDDARNVQFCCLPLCISVLSLNMRKSKASQHDVSEIPYCIALRCLLPVALALEA